MIGALLTVLASFATAASIVAGVLLIALILAALVIAVCQTPRGELPFPHEHGDGEP